MVKSVKKTGLNTTDVVGKAGEGSSLLSSRTSEAQIRDDNIGGTQLFSDACQSEKRTDSTKNATQKSLQNFARTHAQAAIQTLVDIMHDASATPAARMSAAQSILDRGFGKSGSGGDEGGKVLAFADLLKALG